MGNINDEIIEITKKVLSEKEKRISNNKTKIAKLEKENLRDEKIKSVAEKHVKGTSPSLFFVSYLCHNIEDGKLLKPNNAGRPSDYLFKDDELTKRWAKLFVEYLKLHKKWGNGVSSSQKNYIIRAFVAFYLHWEKKGLVDKRCGAKAAACFRFLKEDCCVNIKVKEESVINALRIGLKAEKHKYLSDIEYDVSLFLDKCKL